MGNGLLGWIDQQKLEEFLKPLPVGKVTLVFKWAEIGMGVDVRHESGASADVTDYNAW